VPEFSLWSVFYNYGSVKTMFHYEKSLTPSELDKEFSDISENIAKLGFPEGFSEFVPYAISELFANVKEHSRAKKATVCISVRGNKCVINITDNGIGFRKSYIAKKIYPKDEFSAIEFALGGLSTKSQERGFGLYSIKQLVEELGGEITVKTGKAMVEIRQNKTVSRDSPVYTEGVDIALKIPVKKVEFYKFVQ